MMNAVQDLLSGTAEYAGKETTAALDAGAKTAESALHATSDVVNSAVETGTKTAESALQASSEAVNSTVRAGTETAESAWQASIDAVQSTADTLHEKAKPATTDSKDQSTKEPHKVPQDVMETFPTVE